MGLNNPLTFLLSTHSAQHYVRPWRYSVVKSKPGLQNPCMSIDSVVIEACVCKASFDGGGAKCRSSQLSSQRWGHGVCGLLTLQGVHGLCVLELPLVPHARLPDFISLQNYCRKIIHFLVFLHRILKEENKSWAYLFYQIVLFLFLTEFFVGKRAGENGLVHRGRLQVRAFG